MSNDKMDYVPLIIEGETYFVWAFHFGQLMVHEPPTALQHSLVEWIVTHKSSSAVIASFNDGRDAIDFAEWANTQMDFDAYWQMGLQHSEDLALRAYKVSIDQIKAKRATYHSLYEQWTRPNGKLTIRLPSDDKS